MEAILPALTEEERKLYRRGRNVRVHGVPGGENMLIEDARNMTATDIEHIRQKDDMTVEESQMLLLRMIDEEYQRP